MEIKRTFTVNKSIDATWAVLGNDYGGAYKWGTGLYHTEGKGTPTLSGAEFDQRYCETNVGNITEKVLVFDPKSYQLSYEVIDGFPGFVKSGVNTWTLRQLSPNKTEVSVHFVAVLGGIVGTIMKPIMNWQLSKSFDQVLEDFKVYVETGKPSATKAKELAKRRPKAVDSGA